MSKTNQNPDFTAGLKELEEIANWFETQDIDLDQGLKKFERGMELATSLKKHLSEMQNKVEKIKAKFDDQSLAEDAGVGDPNLFADQD